MVGKIWFFKSFIKIQADILFFGQGRYGKLVRCHTERDFRSACKPDFMLIAYVNNERVDILSMETGRPNSYKQKQE